MPDHFILVLMAQWYWNSFLRCTLKGQCVWIEFSVCFDFYSLLLCTIFKPINSCQYLPTLWHHQDLESDRLKMRIPMHLKYYLNENRDNPKFYNRNTLHFYPYLRSVLILYWFRNCKRMHERNSEKHNETIGSAADSLRQALQ